MVAGRTIHVMTFEVGAVLEDSKWQAPVYCFGEGNESFHSNLEQSVARTVEDWPRDWKTLIRRL